MTEVEKQLLNNQLEIMWTLHLCLGKAFPDLVGRNGELDRFRDDLVSACKKTRLLVDNASKR